LDHENWRPVEKSISNARSKYGIPSSDFILSWGAATSDHIAYKGYRSPAAFMKLSDFQTLENFRNARIPFPIINAVNVPDDQDVFQEGEDFIVVM
jgi:hypothetical protein